MSERPGRPYVIDAVDRTNRRRWWHWGASGLVGLLMAPAAAVWCVGQDAAPPGPETRASADDQDGKAPVAERRREGDRYEAIGQFEITGDRVTFYAADSSESFRVVENLALERVARVLEDPAGLGAKRQWLINAEVLEYRGANYLRLERVVLKGRAPGER